MNDILSVLAALAVWRVLVPAAVAVSIAGLIALLLPALGGPLIATALVLGLGAGVWWQSTSASRSSGTANSSARVHPAVAFLAFAFLGLVWSGLLQAAQVAPAASILIVGLAPYLLGPLIGKATSTTFSARSLTLASVALAIGPSSMFAIVVLTNAA